MLCDVQIFNSIVHVSLLASKKGSLSGENAIIKF